MGLIAGVYGNSNRDEYVWTKKVTYDDGGLKIDLIDDSSRCLRVPDHPSKITLSTIPIEFQRNISKSRAGGGAVNSRIAAERIGFYLGETNEIRLLDANKRDSLIESEVPSPTRYLGLRACPRNYVLGKRDDKWIFRSQIEPAAPLEAPQFVDINWSCEAGTILLNGPKDLEPVAAIVAERERRGFDLIFMVTPSLPVTFLKRNLPAADVVIGAWDELQFLTGHAPVTVGGAAQIAEWLQGMAPRADVHVTMGKRGVLSVAAGSAEAVHVELDGRAAVAAETQDLIRRRPARLCGAGDAFAAGVMVRRAFGWSLLGGGAAAFRSVVQDALAGCVSALRWIGSPSVLAVRAFRIRPFSVAPGAAAAFGGV